MERVQVSELKEIVPKNYEKQIDFGDLEQIRQFAASAHLHLGASTCLYNNRFYRDALIALYSSLECYFKHVYVVSFPFFFSEGQIATLFLREKEKKGVLSFQGKVQLISHDIELLLAVVNVMVDFEEVDELIAALSQVVAIPVEITKTNMGYTALRYLAEKEKIDQMKVLYDLIFPIFQKIIHRYPFNKEDEV